MVRKLIFLFTESGSSVQPPSKNLYLDQSSEAYFLPRSHFQVRLDATLLLHFRNHLPDPLRDDAHHVAQRSGKAPRLLAQALRGHLEQAVQRLRYLVSLAALEDCLVKCFQKPDVAQQ